MNTENNTPLQKLSTSELTEKLRAAWAHILLLQQGLPVDWQNYFNLSQAPVPDKRNIEALDQMQKRLLMLNGFFLEHEKKLGLIIINEDNGQMVHLRQSSEEHAKIFYCRRIAEILDDANFPAIKVEAIIDGVMRCGEAYKATEVVAMPSGSGAITSGPQKSIFLKLLM